MTLSLESLIKEGQAALRAGDKAAARDRLRQAIALDDRSEAAWLWLSGAVETVEEQIACLERVIALNPDNVRAQAGLTRLKAQQNADTPPAVAGALSPVDAMIESARQAEQEGRRSDARDLLMRAAEIDSYNETAWMLLSDLVDDPEERITCLENVLVINPNHQAAAEALDLAKQQRPPSPPSPFDGPFTAADIFSEFDSAFDGPFSAPNEEGETADNVPHLDFDTWAAALNLGTARAKTSADNKTDVEDTAESESRPPGFRPPRKNDYTDLRQRLLKDVMERLEPDFRLVKSPEARDRIETLINDLLAEYNFILSRAERSRLQDIIYAELCGYGPIDVLMEDKAVQAIFVNGPKNIFVEVRGQLSRSPVVFEDDQHVLHHIDRMVAPLGHRIDESYPMTTTRLADGSAVYGMLRPVSLVGPSITIRKLDFTPLHNEDWLRNGSFSMEMLDYLRLCLLSGLSILVAGGISAGKTSLLNLLAGHLPNNHRIVSVERVMRLMLGHEHVVPLEARQRDDYETADLRTRDLIEIAAALRPDVLFFGSRMNDGGGERLFVSPKPPPAKQIIGCMDGNDARDVIERLEITGLQYGDGTLEMIHQRIAGRLNVIVQMRRMRDGSRKITGIWEVDGLIEGRTAVYPLFRFEQIGMERGKVIGRMVQVTPVSRFVTRFKTHGFDLTPLDFDLFGGASSSKR